MDFPHGEPITVITRTRSPEVDSEGNRKWTDTPVTYTGAFAPAIGAEFLVNRDQVSTQPQAFLPADAVVASTSVLVIREDRYEVDGEPAFWVNPFTGWSPGWQVPLRKVTG